MSEKISTILAALVLSLSAAGGQARPSVTDALYEHAFTLGSDADQNFRRWNQNLWNQGEGYWDRADWYRFDRDGNGHLDAGEWGRLRASWNNDNSETNGNQFDLNGDGTLDVSESNTALERWNLWSSGERRRLLER